MLDYKTQEEVLTIIRQLTTVLSTTGLQLVELLFPSHLRKELGAPLTVEANPENSSVPQHTDNLKAAQPSNTSASTDSKGGAGFTSPTHSNHLF